MYVVLCTGANFTGTPSLPNARLDLLSKRIPMLEKLVIITLDGEFSVLVPKHLPVRVVGLTAVAGVDT